MAIFHIYDNLESIKLMDKEMNHTIIELIAYWSILKLISLYSVSVHTYTPATLHCILTVFFLDLTIYVKYCMYQLLSTLNLTLFLKFKNEHSLMMEKHEARNECSMVIPYTPSNQSPPLTSWVYRCSPAHQHLPLSVSWVVPLHLNLPHRLVTIFLLLPH